MQEAIRGGATDEEIRAAGERAALEFRQESELIKRSKNMQGDAQTRLSWVPAQLRIHVYSDMIINETVIDVYYAILFFGARGLGCLCPYR
eukprot:1157822-Pelagomonas_calceolata.AAC.9